MWFVGGDGQERWNGAGILNLHGERVAVGVANLSGIDFGVNIDDFETRDSRRIIPGVCFSIEPGIYLEGKFGVRSEINVYVSDKDIEVTGQPIQTEIIPILKTP